MSSSWDKPDAETLEEWERRYGKITGRDITLLGEIRTYIPKRERHLMHPWATALLVSATFWGIVIFGFACCEGAL